jgi:tetratricopeptide (TPR) repeat protein
MQGDYDRAIADYTEAIRLAPTSAWAYCRRANAYLFKDEFDRVIADCDEAIRLDPTYAWAYCSRGHAFAAKGDFRSAIADLTEYLRLDPSDEVVKQQLEVVKQEKVRAQSRKRRR